MAIPQKNKPAGKVPVKRPRNPDLIENQGNTASQPPVDPNPRDSKRARTEPNPTEHDSKVHRFKVKWESRNPVKKLKNKAASIKPGEYLEFISLIFNEQDLANMPCFIGHAAKNLVAGTSLVFNFWDDFGYFFDDYEHKATGAFLQRKAAVLSAAASAMPVGTKLVLVLPGISTPLDFFQNALSHLNPGVTLVIDFVSLEGISGNVYSTDGQYENYLEILANLTPGIGLEFVEGTPSEFINKLKKARQDITSSPSSDESEATRSIETLRDQLAGDPDNKALQKAVFHYRALVAQRNKRIPKARRDKQTLSITDILATPSSKPSGKFWLELSFQTCFEAVAPRPVRALTTSPQRFMSPPRTPNPQASNPQPVTGRGKNLLGFTPIPKN